MAEESIDRSSQIIAKDGLVLFECPDGRILTYTAKAAVQTAQTMFVASVEALGQLHGGSRDSQPN